MVMCVEAEYSRVKWRWRLTSYRDVYIYTHPRSGNDVINVAMTSSAKSGEYLLTTNPQSGDHKIPPQSDCGNF